MARILVVDDDGAIRSVVRFALENAGHEVMVAGEGEAALERMAATMPDAIVLDLMMPRLDGLGFLERLSEQNGHEPPVLVLTARVDLAEEVQGMGHRVLEKPFSPRALKSLVAAMVADTPLDRSASG